jgi:hypothetical protein
MHRCGKSTILDLLTFWSSTNKATWIEQQCRLTTIAFLARIDPVEPRQRGHAVRGCRWAHNQRARMVYPQSLSTYFAQVQSGCVYRGKAMFLVVGRMSMVSLAAGSPLLQTRLVQLNRSNWRSLVRSLSSSTKKLSHCEFFAWDKLWRSSRECIIASSYLTCVDG